MAMGPLPEQPINPQAIPLSEGLTQGQDMSLAACLW